MTGRPLSLVLALGIASAVAPLSSCASSGAPVVMREAAGAFCGAALSAKDWDRRHHEPTAFGMGELVVRGDSPVAITKVRLVGGNGRLRLTNASFVPAGSVGIGVPWHEVGTTGSTFPASWARHQDMPGAVLTRLRPTKRDLATDPDADGWQLVVGVQPTADLSTASAVQIDYRVGQRIGSLTTSISVALARTEAGCDKT
jgi:hypothetical protein